ncbi:diphthine--ammonia ligase [Chloroflexota bacterium]
MNQVFASWSGGKDCCLAAYRAIKNGMEIRYLANTITGDGKKSCSHGLSADIIKLQSQAIGIPVVQKRTTGKSYETVFKDMLREFKQEGIEGGIFGDIDFNEHRKWIERVCQATDIIPYLPLWLESQDKLMREFISLGFKAVVVATKSNLLGEEWLGREINLDFIKDLDELSRTRDITPCGEAGEYHSLVIDGPIFPKRIEILKTENISRDEHCFLEISDLKLTDK